jgi:putative transcriptional regulator
MAVYHPSEVELTEYSAGTLPWALSIAMAAHIHFCPQCKARVNELNALGAQLMDGSSASDNPSSQLAPDCLSKTLSRIRQAGADEQVQPSDSVPSKTSNSVFDGLPKAIKKIIGNPKELSWSFVSPSLRAARLSAGQKDYEVSLHRIKKGGSVAEHDHRGLEVVVVLDGSFSDENGTYKPGDYLVKNPGDCHRPTATMDRDCLCLSIVEAPVSLTGLLGKFVNPFLKINPA